MDKPSTSGVTVADIKDEESVEYGVKKKLSNFQPTLHVTQIIKDRYFLIKLLGEGTYSTVFKAMDSIKKINVAVKICINDDVAKEIAEQEYKMLSIVNKHESRIGISRFVKCLDHFTWNGRSCLVFELLQESLHDFIGRTSNIKLNLESIQKIGLQLLYALTTLSKPEVDIIHGDLKLDNVLLCHGHLSKVKICDFGLAQQVNHKISSVIQNFRVRAPEVFLGLDFDQQVDIWSIGCMLLRMFTGRIIFMGPSEDRQMETLVKNLGIPSTEFLDRCPNTSKYFDTYKGKYFLKNTTKVSTINNIFLDLNHYERHFKGCSLIKFHQFQDLLKKIFDFDPVTRITASAAVNHAFFK